MDGWAPISFRDEYYSCHCSSEGGVGNLPFAVVMTATGALLGTVGTMFAIHSQGEGNRIGGSVIAAIGMTSALIGVVGICSALYLSYVHEERNQLVV